ncbi:hypothetical protein EsH8_II_001251 [Colletotrichum jinshuiense]
MSPRQIIRRTLRNAGCVDRSLPLLPPTKPWQQQILHPAESRSSCRRLLATSHRPGPLMQLRRGFHSLGYHRSSTNNNTAAATDAAADAAADMTLSRGLPRSNSCKARAKARLKEVLTPELLDKLHRFWYKHLKTDEAFILPQKSQMGRWFFSDSDFDNVCVKRFRPVLEVMRSADAKADDILAIVRPFTPLQWLGLVLLLDQIPRNCYRGPESSVVFKFFDPIAREIAQHAINAGAPVHGRFKYRVSYRMWFYLPFMHSEDLALHDLAVKQYQQMKDDFAELMAQDGTAGTDDERKCWGVLALQKETAKDLLETNYDFEMKHRDIIAQFGRYPHRNAAMEREPTAEEKKYLESGGETFGGGGGK